MPLGDRYCEDERLLTYWLLLFKIMLIICNKKVKIINWSVL